MLLLLLAPLNAVAGAAVHFQVTDLNGVATEVPSGLPQGRALLLLGFRHNDHTALDAWRDGLGLSSRDSDWFEVPVIGVGNPMIRGVILRGMRNGVTATADRARFAPAFADAAAIALQLGIDPSEPAAVVIDRTGRVLAHASGAFEPGKAAALMQVLRH
ncbi:hypothetical protein [Phenylobacterium sp.]|uniref:hypothetical protein n=1 Tax=Phenylobacterium sp. TaxID=1871053 RepID=UPI001204FDB0|nr:hypothetical protein [Phenylobacterium sp.]THD52391.1 MAG: hypothetical protein E8A12_19770 [Phenylobacterium sp.]